MDHDRVRSNVRCPRTSTGRWWRRGRYRLRGDREAAVDAGFAEMSAGNVMSGVPAVHRVPPATAFFPMCAGRPQGKLYHL